MNTIKIIIFAVLLAILIRMVIDIIVERTAKKVQKMLREEHRVMRMYIEREMLDEDYNKAKDHLKDSIKRELDNE